MRLNMETVLNDLKGKPIQTPKEDKPTEFEDFTLGAAIINVMLQPMEEDKKSDGKAKMRQYRIAQKASAGGEQDFPTEELADIKARVGSGYTPLIVGIIYDIIDPPVVAKEG